MSEQTVQVREDDVDYVVACLLAEDADAVSYPAVVRLRAALEPEREGTVVSDIKCWECGRIQTHRVCDLAVRCCRCT